MEKIVNLSKLELLSDTSIIPSVVESPRCRCSECGAVGVHGFDGGYDGHGGGMCRSNNDEPLTICLLSNAIGDWQPANSRIFILFILFILSRFNPLQARVGSIVLSENKR